MVLETAARAAIRDRIGNPPAPALMAIGDGFYNGMRSATIDDDKAQLAPPVLVAAALGETFQPACYPRVVMGDLEQAYRDLAQSAVNVAGLRARILETVAAWEADLLTEGARSPAGPALFDNIAVAGAEVDDLIDPKRGSATAARRMFAGALKRFRAASGLPGDELVEMHMGINTAHLLNPHGLPELDGLTQTDWVDIRRPRRLLVSIGQNDGLTATIMAGKRINVFDRKMAKLPDRMRALGEALAPALADTDQIVLNGLSKPSAVANLRPRAKWPDDQEPGRDPKAKGYWRRYVGYLAGRGDMTGRDVAELDEQAAVLSAAAADAFRAGLGQAGERLVVVDLAARMAEVDRKHRGDAAHAVSVRVKGQDLSLANLILDDETSSLYGLDNLHLNAVGNGLLAGWVADAISPGASARIDLQALADRDRLLQDRPPLLGAGAFLISLLSPFVTFERI
ncbi:hypothetical protein P7L78_09790 [Tistrella bauzanensis]|uniref:hypothetical protein n=1 Tax=Tistrella TaxID=171436 RepID=UPI0031F67AFB